jgi:hypothetical protein
LELHSPTHDVQVFENTSWSCVHGIERWRSNCGCNTGRAGWNQEWRAPLRAAMDMLRDKLAPRYEERARALLKDPWGARNEYIRVILDRSPENIDRFLSEQATHELNEDEKITVLKLLEMQRHAMLMYTSCGWFFDELSGIETVQVIQYAGRVVHLAQDVFGFEVESEFVQALSKAKSNLPEHGDGARIYERWVEPAVVDLQKVGAHYAISSLFEAYDDHTRIYSFSADRKAYSSIDSGNNKLAVGRSRFISTITRESAELTFAVIHFGDQNINGGVRNFEGQQTFEALLEELSGNVSRGDIPEIIRVLDREFGHVYSLPSLFRDEQRKIVAVILDSALEEAASAYRAVYEHHATLMRFLTSIGMPRPKALVAAAEFALNRSLKEAFRSDPIDVSGIRALLEEASTLNVTLDIPTLEYTFRRRIEQVAREACENASDQRALQKLETAVNLAHITPFKMSFWEVQNICFAKLRAAHEEISANGARKDDAVAQEWQRLFASLAKNLSLRLI